MTATDTYMLLRALCDELARCGLEHACTSPGSRSTPLVLSLVGERRINCWSHVDERCAAFFAVGAAKASGRPVAVTCTSGTAGANFAPAVIEAAHARVPLIVLTADRPAELREIGAGQTIDQLKLYGDAVKWFFEVGVHDSTPDRLRWIRTLACRAYWTAAAGPPGPVHLNFPLPEPLVLDEPLPGDPTGRDGGRPFVSFDRPRPSAPPAARHPFGRTVIVAGRDERNPEAAARLAEFAARAGMPLLADPLSGARSGPAAIAHYDLLLRDPAFAAAHRPQVVLRVGDLPTSKPLRAWLATLDALQIAIDPDDTWQDPDSVVGLRVSAPYEVLLDGLAASEGVTTEEGWLDSWRAADATAADAIARTLGSDLSEPVTVTRLGALLPANATLFVASSMPVRDVEEFLPARADPPRVLSNRGANGIDGTVSSAFGAAAASARAAAELAGAATARDGTAAAGSLVLLIGDVALAHDIGGLLAARRLGLAITIVLVNNDGGGIFHFLPVAGNSIARARPEPEMQDAFVGHIATPHGLDFSLAAALYGCGHQLVTTIAELDAAVAESLDSATTTIIEIRTDREDNLALHRRVSDAVLAALAV
jgi:2-succinyl-5-enolpyruvyl-6-hydroxy-3-cyclohexene-1-carboxylate synthase